MINHEPNLAIVGATGAVGAELLSILAERRFPVSGLRLFASERSAGRVIAFRDEQIKVQPLGDGCFDGVDLALFCAHRAVSVAWAPKAVEAGAFVVDNSSAFRMGPDTPLIVPEVNGELIDALDSPAIITNPNCSTIIALMAVTPLHRAAGVARMVVSTYQSVSGAGAAAMAELEQQARDFAADRPLRHKVFHRPTLFNLFSHDSAIGPDGYNEEEMKLLRETRKIWNDNTVAITATCVRVPVLRAHSEAINLTFRDSLSEDDAREILSHAPGVTVIDDREGNRFPEPVNATGKDDVLVGRIRSDLSQPPGKGLDLFVSGDQLRKGAALNAVQIAERVMRLQMPV